MGAAYLGWISAGLFTAVVMGPAATGLGAGPQLDLRGSEWGFAEETVDPQRSVQFDGEGRVSGSGGCNRFAGSFEQRDDRLKIGQLAPTLIGCEPEVAQRERAFLNALTAAHRIEATHVVLKIYGVDGGLLLDLVRRDWD